MMESNTFGRVLQQILSKQGLSASQAARMVGFRSRNSIFRILSGETGVDVDARFLQTLKDTVGEEWPAECWRELEKALEIKRVGLQQYRNDQAFFSLLREPEPGMDVRVDRADGTITLHQMLRELLLEAKLEIVICGCCDARLLRQLAETLSSAGEEGSVTVRHYIDISAEQAVGNILGVLPLVSKPWYNARLMEENSCSPEMLALYRVHMIHVYCTGRDGRLQTHQLVRYESDRFVHTMTEGEQCGIRSVLDRCRFQLDLLKPMESLGEGSQVFIRYTEQCRRLEENSVICSIKPDICFNCLPTELLLDAITEGFRAEGGNLGLDVENAELTQLMEALVSIHTRRVENMFSKHKRTDLVFSVHAMEQFMRTGVQTDHFFLQRPYTLEERRRIIRCLYEQMLHNPYFNIHFLKPDAPTPQNEITLYEGKGVLLMDAYTGYALPEEHSEAVIELPVFMESFGRFFRENVLKRQVLARRESLEVMKHLMEMEIE